MRGKKREEREDGVGGKERKRSSFELTSHYFLLYVCLLSSRISVHLVRVVRGCSSYIKENTSDRYLQFQTEKGRREAKELETETKEGSVSAR